MKTINKIACLGALLTVSHTALAEISWSGFGSIVGGQTLSEGERFTADFFEVGQYENSFTFKPDSMLAIQATMDLSDKVTGTAQLVSKGAEDFEPELDWLYITYKIDDSWSLLAGRRNIPIYYYSEFYDVGYAYPWIRPASNLYWWQIVQFNGVHLVHDFEWGDYTNSINVYYGNEYTDDNTEMGFYAEQGFFGPNTVEVNEDWRHIVGFNWNISGEMFDIRFVYMQHKLERDFVQRDGSINIGPRTSQNFYGVGGSIDLNPVTVLFDYNYVKRNNAVEDVWPTFLVSLVYNIGDYQPFVSYSKADQERISGDDFEQHTVVSFGVRYDFEPGIAFKVQYDSFNDQGNPVGGWNFHGDADAIAVGVDFVF